jgi:excisionase family DNA binding protein
MDARKLYRISHAAQKTGVGRSTIQAAIGRGEIDAVVTGCGLPLVTLAAVRSWAKADRKPGPKPAATG